MMRALYSAATGMQSEQIELDVIANNMANVNTTGFKKRRVDFQDLLYQTIHAPGAISGVGRESPTGMQVGQGVRPVSTQMIISEGDLKQTQNPLDLAIMGAGYFQVTQPSGMAAYTRAGNFKVDAQGTIVTSDGFPVEPQITIPPDAESVSISADGIVSIKRQNQGDTEQLGQLQLAVFNNPAGLMALGRNLLTDTTASGQPILTNAGENGAGGLQQGFLESSNVQMVDEMIGMVVVQRAYEMNSKVIATADQMLRTATNIR